MSDEFQSHERVTATKLNRALRTGACIARARRVTNSNTSASTTLVPVLELDDVPLIGGRQYEIVSCPLALDTSIANDLARVVLTYTTDGSTPTIASAVLLGSQCNTPLVNTSSPAHALINTTYTPAADETLSLLLCLSRVQGTGTIVLQADGTTNMIEFRVRDASEDPGDTGVDL